MRAQGATDVNRKHGDAVFPSFAIAHENLVSVELYVFHPQTNGLHDSQARAVQQIANQAMKVRQAGQHLRDFGVRQYDRQPRRCFGAYDAVEPWQLHAEDFAIEE